MNPNELTDPELSLWLGEVLQGSHKPQLYGPYDDPPSTSIGCRNCHQIVHDVTQKQREAFWKECCPIPRDDWNVAHKWGDWAAENDKEAFGDEMWGIYCFLSKDGQTDIKGFENFLLFEAQPRHYLMAAAKLKEKSNGP